MSPDFVRCSWGWGDSPCLRMWWGLFSGSRARPIRLPSQLCPQSVIPSSRVIYGQRFQHQRHVPHVMRGTLIPRSLGSGHCGSGWPGGHCLHLKQVPFAPRAAGLSPGREGGGQGTFHRVKAASLRISTSSCLLSSQEVTTISST